HQRPAIAAGLGFRYDSVEAFGKIFTISAVFKDRLAFDPSNDNSLQGTEGIYADFTRHGGFIQITELL
ncbi:MAG: hypothetical protein WBN03_12565, partial [Desulfobacterales bacterium]